MIKYVFLSRDKGIRFLKLFYEIFLTILFISISIDVQGGGGRGVVREVGGAKVGNRYYYTATTTTTTTATATTCSATTTNTITTTITTITTSTSRIAIA